MTTIDVLTPTHRAELKQKLGDRRLDGSAHAELLTDAETGLPVIGLTLGTVGGAAITVVIDHGPAIDRIRDAVVLAEREIARHVDDDDGGGEG